MEEKLGIITKEDLEVLSKQAFESAKSKGFYSDTGIDTTPYLMFIIVEMSEALQADRKNRHGSIEDYEIEIDMGRDFPTAYRNNINLMEHIRLKMKYNETRPYLHGYKY